MLIALESGSTSGRIELPLLHHEMSCGSVYDSSDSGGAVFGMFAGGRCLPGSNTVAPALNVVEVRAGDDDSTSSSSIGRNSDSSGGLSGGQGDSGDGEVQSSYKGPLDALEEVLPIKRSMSQFYMGKSKSFTSLADAASCSSIKDIVKPENSYTRRRRNLLAYSTFWDKNRDRPLRSSKGGISKKPANSSRSTLALAISVSNLESKINGESSTPSSSSPVPSRPPLYPHGRRSPNNELSSSPHPRNFSPWRSFSLSDLQCADSATPSNNWLNNE